MYRQEVTENKGGKYDLGGAQFFRDTGICFNPCRPGTFLASKSAPYRFSSSDKRTGYEHRKKRKEKRR